ncbi:MAG: chemotaxis protein CheB [Bacteroidota bacterium]|jgi:sigma-B regulation protein RsbU (phosphoserine phosphatase)
MEKEGVIVIGGSAGSIEVIINLLPYIPESFPYPIVIVLHRKSTVEYHLEDVLNKKCKLQVFEIQDKMQLEGNKIYLVPGDYHLLVDSSGCLSLDYSEKVNFSRPSIDVTYDSFAKAFGENCLGILLSGANADGAIGLKRIQNSGGLAIVQSPESATVPTMPMAAISMFKPDIIADVMKMIGIFNELNQISFSEFRAKLKQGEQIENNLPAVLIVDDLEDNLFTLNALLKSEPIIIHKANSGKKAIELANKTQYDCIILDVQMPEMDGFEVAKILGESEETKNIPIIFLSALGSDKEKVIQGIDSGAIDFIAKPPDPALLKAKVKLCLNISKKTKQSRKVFSNVKQERDSYKEHKADVEASLRYARNIQQAILPNQQVFDHLFRENFVLYQPKESIGGDFYTVKEQEDKIILICGDCTGHGVPGAMMTMISVNIIQNLIEGKGITQPDKLLNAMNKEFRNAFNSEFSAITIDDGLEMAVCTFLKNENKMQFSSSRRPILFKHNGKLQKLEPDYMGISGTMPEDYTFTLAEFDLMPGDLIYLFTDGVVDQFGGKHGKKFMAKRLVDLIQSYWDKPFQDQKELLNNAIQEWKGDIEQIDDILLLGIRY